MQETTELSCGCGGTTLGVRGAPILCAECCCTSCRTAGAKLQGLPGAPQFLEPSGQTRFVLYRKDRVELLRSSAPLKELRLTPESPTRRVVATCCNTPVFLEFEKGHWLSLYACLWPKERLPPLEMRTMTMDLPPGVELPNDVPNGKRQPASFMFKLLGAWIAMGFKSPKVPYVDGALQL